jgi:hypothetical protein
MQKLRDSDNGTSQKCATSNSLRIETRQMSSHRQKFTNFLTLTRINYIKKHFSEVILIRVKLYSINTHSTKSGCVGPTVGNFTLQNPTHRLSLA